MITNVSLVSVWVKDQDASLAFYTDVLGFEVGDDVRLAEDFRWLTVKHPSQPELHLHLTTLTSALGGAAGSDPPLARRRRDARRGPRGRRLPRHLRGPQGQGVEFLQEPAERPYGVEALLRDNSGNWMVLVEHREFDPSSMAVDDLDGAGLPTSPDFVEESPVARFR